MKLIVQIPALNEQKAPAETISTIPREIDGISSVEILISDDGSTDNTIDVAKKAGADHILEMSSHVGLARAYSAGVERALSLGANIIVNTDADNQYCANDIPAFITPIQERKLKTFRQ